ncbi:MerR family transcriptional regulator [Leptolyngbya sp. BL0902]|nr:MerR family transcriptional regulator [Leptolyngbya sp. BL0902]
MHQLQRFADQATQWALDDFVEVANQLLPQFLPDGGAESRIQETVNARLVRHYSTSGLLDKPLKQGREARYTYRHLLQLLVLRRLLTEGYGSGAIGQLISNKTNHDLEVLLQGGTQLTVEAANPALAFLAKVQARSAEPISLGSGPRVAGVARSAPPPVSPAAPTASRWVRHPLLEGLELHIREDFRYPTTPQERDALLQLIAQVLASSSGSSLSSASPSGSSPSSSWSPHSSSNPS